MDSVMPHYVVRTVDVDDKVTVNLWSTKSRVAPLSTKSLPRFELMGAYFRENPIQFSDSNR